MRAFKNKSAHQYKVLVRDTILPSGSKPSLGRVGDIVIQGSTYTKLVNREVFESIYSKISDELCIRNDDIVDADVQRQNCDLMDSNGVLHVARVGDFVITRGLCDIEVVVGSVFMRKYTILR